MRAFVVGCVAVLLSITGGAQTDSLSKIIEKTIGNANATVGVAVRHFGNNVTMVNNNRHYPMQSVYKLPLAIAVLHAVDEGKLSLEQQVPVTKKDLLPKTWSPLREKYPEGGISLPLKDVIAYAVSQSDNNACDILFRLMGGTKKVQRFIHSLGNKNIAIEATEEEMAKEWKIQYTNWATPASLLHLLDVVYNGKELSKTSNDFLITTMRETSTGPKRIKGLLPAGTVVAHKTGTSATNAAGLTAATNDVGIVTLPNGKQFGIVVLVSDATMPEVEREKLIAGITKNVWDYFIRKGW